jgi:hypothetical protein
VPFVLKKKLHDVQYSTGAIATKDAFRRGRRFQKNNSTHFPHFV